MKTAARYTSQKNPTAQIMGLDDYIAAQTKSGFFSDCAAAPEHDPRVWHDFLSMCRDWCGFEPEHKISLHLGTYAFTYDPVDPDRAGQNFALVTHMVDPCLPVTAAQFKDDAPALMESLSQSGEKILTDTFFWTDGYGAPGIPGTAWIQSPVAKIDTDFETYINGLAQERRKKYRRMARDFEETKVIFTLSQTPLTDAEITFARGHLTRKWGEEEGLWALQQTLWSCATARYRPEQTYVMRVTEGDTLAFVQTLIRRRDTVYCQSIFKNEDLFFDGIAPFTDFKCIESLCNGNILYFDPSCRCALDDPETIGIAKRVTVNQDRLKPVFISGGHLTDEQQSVIDNHGTFGRPA